VLVAGGWAPLAVFLLHVVLDAGLDAYAAWPRADVPMHFAGGAAMCFFLSRVVRPLVAGATTGRAAALETLLAGSLTVTVAVLWEFGEFALDRLVGSTLQVGLANTMQDLALGMLGALAYLATVASTRASSR
jgi:hypothetical protein